MFSKHILNEIKPLTRSPSLSADLHSQIDQLKEDDPERHSLSSFGSSTLQVWSPDSLSQQPKMERVLEMADEIPFGQIAWNDLTVPNADPIRDFYETVVGWSSSSVSMGDYSDYSMTDAEGNVVAGICHARGENDGIPPCWLMYVTVADLDASVEKCLSSGGKVVDGPRATGNARIAVIQDPAGAVLALFEPETPTSGEPESAANDEFPAPAE